jgi:hypothetical protein
VSSQAIRIGGASGFWGDAGLATPQLVGAGNLDYIVFDYLAEITMSIMARARARNPDMGYASDFVSVALKPNLNEIARQKIRIISNAGGVNPAACGAAVRRLAKELDLDLTVAVIEGDDLIERCGALAAGRYMEMFSGVPFPDADKVASINAYLGAFPIARALDAGADIVITGRCVDSAVTLGACIHEFGWRREDTDLLAQGSLAGHILECGPQACGGNFTDWEIVADSIEDIGYPIAEVTADGCFTVTKPQGSGGAVTVGTVAEQMLYEIGDPQAYMLPDVVCDFSTTKIRQVGDDCVAVGGATGRPAPDTYKICLTHEDGYRGGHVFTFYGIDADRKAQRFADAAMARARRALRAVNAADYTDTSIEIIGAESQFGAGRRIDGAREVTVKIAARHESDTAIALLLREATGLALSSPPGLSGFAGARPKPSPVMALFSFELPRCEIVITISVDGHDSVFVDGGGAAFDAATLQRPDAPSLPEMHGNMVAVPLIKLAWGRSGDKGDKANVGIIARHEDYLPYIWKALSEERVAACFAHFLKGPVERYLLPGSNAVNFVLHEVLGGGGVASLRNDPQGKGYAQLLLCEMIEIPDRMARALT